MKYQLTSHAVFRFIKRVEPDLNYLDASAFLIQLLERSSFVKSKTRKGTQGRLLPHPKNPVALIKSRTERKDSNNRGAVVISIYSSEQWNNDIDEDGEDYTEYLENLRSSTNVTVKNWENPTPIDISPKFKRTIDIINEKKPLADNDDRDILWARIMALIEVERRRIAHFECDKLRATDAVGTLFKILNSLSKNDIDNVKNLAESWHERNKHFEEISKKVMQLPDMPEE